MTGRPGPSAPRFLAGLALAALLGALPAAAGPAGAAQARDRELVLHFEGLPDLVRGGSSLPTDGSTATRAVLRTHAGGAARPVARVGGGAGLRLPALDPAATLETVRLAVVEVTTAQPGGLDPGASPFVLGASVRMDQVSTGSAVDNGDNVIQRGTYASASQYKLQVDGRLPSCRVKGVAGAVTVTADRRLRAGRWYDLRCRRSVAGLVLSVARDRAQVVDEVRRTSAAGATGSLSALAADVPVSVGGKLDDTGALRVSEADQLNGSVDDAFLDILR